MPKLILIDWGTSSFRLWGVDQAFNVVLEHRSSCGMVKLKPDEFKPFLENTLLEFGLPSDAPILICGMAGSAQGWQDTGYVNTPTELDVIATKAVKINVVGGRDIRILPGIAQRNIENPDVMRGEETLLLGAQYLHMTYSTYCLPGTHSKWVFMEGHMVRSFATVMTGELFALLSEQSTLSHYLKTDTQPEMDNAAFKLALNEALMNPEKFTQSLFKLRAVPLNSRRCAFTNLFACV